MSIGQQEDPGTWRCGACRTLIGIARGDLIEVKYKQAVFEIRGTVTTRCRRCGTPSAFDTSLGHVRS